MYKLFGEKVFTTSDKNGYNYITMTKDQIQTYWSDKVNCLGLDGDIKYDTYYLLEGLEKAIDDWDENPSVGLPFYRSRKMTKICTGWDYGHIYIFGSFSGRGKTSLTVNKLFMSCINAGERLLVIANEQTIKEFQNLVLITALGINGITFCRQRILEGSYTDEEKQKLKQAVSGLIHYQKAMIN